MIIVWVWIKDLAIYCSSPCDRWGLTEILRFWRRDNDDDERDEDEDDDEDNEDDEYSEDNDDDDGDTYARSAFDMH